VTLGPVSGSVRRVMARLRWRLSRAASFSAASCAAQAAASSISLLWYSATSSSLLICAAFSFAQAQDEEHQDHIRVECQV